MSEPFTGQIMLAGFSYAPRSWAHCDGQILQIASNTALFSLLGTVYGGDGRTTFGLPDLRGRVAVHPGNGPGLTPIRQGEKSGTNTNSLNVNNLPSHNHLINADGSTGTKRTPENNFLGGDSTGDFTYKDTVANAVTMNSTVVSHTGGNVAVNNMQPFQGVYFIIALQGVFPSRN